MNAMTVAVDMDAFHAQQEETLKKMTKGKLISYVGKMESELTAYRKEIATLKHNGCVNVEKIGEAREFIQHQAHQIENLKTNEELRETAIQGLKDEIDDMMKERQKMRDILDEAEAKNLIFYRDHEYCFNGENPASATHLEGLHKHMKVIHEADPITGMW